eukprot:1185398-Amphidinium_carterae.1
MEYDSATDLSVAREENLVLPTGVVVQTTRPSKGWMVNEHIVTTSAILAMRLPMVEISDLDEADISTDNVSDSATRPNMQNVATCPR